MKTLFLIVSLVAASFAHADVVTLLDTEVKANRGTVEVAASFFVDTETKEGFVNIKVGEKTETPDICRHYNCPGYTGSVIRTLLKTTVKVEGLELVDNKIIFHGREGAVECGTLGVSRVLRRSTIYLTGKCELDSQVLRGHRATQVLVTLKTR